MSVWNEVLIGFVFIAGGCWGIRIIYEWGIFRRSIYRELYSSYFEYYFRKKRVVRLSQSYYLANRIGKHRIFYQIAQAKKDGNPQAYVLILHSSGIYILNIKKEDKLILMKQKGHIKWIRSENSQKPVLLNNPLDESRYFLKEISKKVKNIQQYAKSIIVFPEGTDIQWEGKADEQSPVIQRSKLIETLESEIKKSKNKLSDDEIDKMYYELANDVILMEGRV